MPRLIIGTRVELICPCTESVHFDAFTDLIYKLQDRDDDIKEWGGFTHTSYDPPVFTGYFYKKAESQWDRPPDRNVILFIDAPERVVSDVLPFLDWLGSALKAVYRAEAQQDAFWITAREQYIVWD